MSLRGKRPRRWTWDEVVERIAEGTLDPYTAADDIFRRVIK